MVIIHKEIRQGHLRCYIWRNTYQLLADVDGFTIVMDMEPTWSPVTPVAPQRSHSPQWQHP